MVNPGYRGLYRAGSADISSFEKLSVTHFIVGLNTLNVKVVYGNFYKRKRD